MENKTILGSWCSNPICKFIDDKHIQIELLAHIWYSYDNDSKTDVINRKLCFVKEIGFNELNYEAEIIEEDKKIEKLNNIPINYADDRTPEEVYEYLRCTINNLTNVINTSNENLFELIDKVNSLEDKE